VLGEALEHVIEEADTGLDLSGADAIEIKLDDNLRLFGGAFYSAFTHFRSACLTDEGSIDALFKVKRKKTHAALAHPNHSRQVSQRFFRERP
jgi:hypothetical protein